MTKLNKNDYLDKEEKDLAEALKTIDISSLPNPSNKIQSSFREAASNFVKQESKMNIRINSAELDQIKERASREGLKYQSFIKSILHKYITGQLVEAKIG